MGDATINQNKKHKKSRSGLQGKDDFFFGHNNSEVLMEFSFIHLTNI